MVRLRRDLHRHPELSWQEQRTAARISDELTELGIPHRTGVAGTGIVADLPGASGGPLIALRADMDALPVTEETELPFASEVPGVMHACGHDGHCAMLVGAAALLNAAPPPTPVRLLFQPAEEQARGAQRMIEEGALEGVAAIFAGHLDRHFPPGVVAVTDGTVNASTDRFEIVIKGRGGHGARPHEALDAVVVGSLLVTALQTIVSREIDPAHPSVVSIGRFDAGEAANVIAARARLEGTIRAQDAETRDHLRQAVARIARAVGELHRAEVDVQLVSGTPPVVNVPAMAAIARDAARSALGPDSVAALHKANMGGEDFARFLEHVPGCYVRIGGRLVERESYPAHSSRFDFDEAALGSGAGWLAAVAALAGRRAATID
jgi:amidohydrolase